MEFLALSGWFAWTIAGLIFFSVMCWSVERDNAAGATFTVLAFGAFFQFFTDFKPLGLILDRPLFSLGLFAAYLAAGTVWGVVKWAFFVYRVRDAYDAARSRYMLSKGLTEATLTDPLRKSLVEYAQREIGYALPVRVTQHKSRVTTWMVYWPVSAAWTLLHDPITRFYSWSYARIAGLLQSISARAFSRFEADFKA
jgi:hypothetical protein